MKKIIVYFKKYQRIIKWIFLNIFVISFGISIIINITYLPKYWALSKRSDNALNIEIIAFDRTHNNEKLFDMHYESTMVTLGDLMANYPDNYELKDKGALAREVYSITFYDEKLQENRTLVGGTELGNEYRWKIDDNNNVQTSGIDSVYLHNYDVYKLYYWKE
ncbi:hypothetical protein [Spiroplasma sp. AdecLV25b]|uniref:hypothetical protein n=1 Tax=Spiroplasma sp. AdecLV25b TaxID=3027162 RepID=UPI0027DFE3E6|nr:hypothetical protein [Spiroplasma sp. AdecLV25b]